MTPHELAVLAQRAYDEPPTFSAGGVEVLQVEVGRDVVFAFRGTELDGRDILRDLRGAPWCDRELGWCHAGFLKGVRAVWPALERALAPGPRGAVTFTGHSKGGAEATIAAALAIRTFGPASVFPLALVTFGSPRTGFAPLGAWLTGADVKRYVRGRDAVTAHPWPLWGYRHVGAAMPLGAPRHRWRDHRIQGYIDDLARLSEAG